MSTTSPSITKQQSIPATEAAKAPTSLVFSPQSPQSPLEPLSPRSPSSAGSGICSPLSFQSPVHDSTDALSARNERSGADKEVCAYEGYVARRSAILKRWKDRKPITVITGMLCMCAIAILIPRVAALCRPHHRLLINTVASRANDPVLYLYY